MLCCAVRIHKSGSVTIKTPTKKPETMLTPINIPTPRAAMKSRVSTISRSRKPHPSGEVMYAFLFHSCLNLSRKPRPCDEVVAVPVPQGGPPADVLAESAPAAVSSGTLISKMKESPSFRPLGIFTSPIDPSGQRTRRVWPAWTPFGTMTLKCMVMIGWALESKLNAYGLPEDRGPRTDRGPRAKWAKWRGQSQSGQSAVMTIGDEAEYRMTRH